MKEFKNIVYVADQAGGDDPAVERIMALAENNQARVTMLYVWEGVPQEGSGPIADLRGILRRRSLERFAADTAPFAGRAQVEAKVLFGRPFVEIIREVLRHGRDLVVKTSYGGRGLRERLFGSTDMHLLRKCPCPVWLLQSAQEGPYSRILAAVDFTPSEIQAEESGLNHQILELAVSLAIAEFAELYIVHAWDAIAESMLRIWGNDTPADLSAYVETERRANEYGLQALMEQLENRVGADALTYANPHLHLPRGAASHVIPQLALDLDVDLIVMGTVGRTGVPGLLIGNTAETILNRIGCAVLAVKPPGFVSPIQPE